MNAVKFIEERNRMCKSFGDDCVGCPANDNNYRCKFSIDVGDEAAKQVELLEEWSAAHPRKTRQNVFLEQFPNAPIYTNTHNVALDPCLVDTTLRGHCPTGRGCDTCRREFWMQEVES